MEYFEVDVEDESQNRTVRYKFAMHDKTILPRLEDELFETRQRVKRMMKDEKDSFMYSVLDRRQVRYDKIRSLPLLHIDTLELTRRLYSLRSRSL